MKNQPKPAVEMEPQASIVVRSGRLSLLRYAA